MTPRFLWIALVACALFELAAHARIRSQVPTAADYEEAGAQLRSAFLPGDAIAASPAYLDPLLRAEVGDLIPLSMAGRPDLSAYRRLWTLGTSPQPKASPGAELEWSRAFGALTLSRHRLPEPTVIDNLVERLASAEVTVDSRGSTRPCRRVQGRPEGGVALGRGTVVPAQRFACGPGRDHMVAAVVIEDLQLQPRYCVWQPALAGRTLRVRMPRVPMGEELVIDAGLYYEHERNESEPPVTLAVLIDGSPELSLTHRDGDGFQRTVIPTPHMQQADLTFEVTSTRTRHPGFCWAASTRRASR